MRREIWAEHQTRIAEERRERVDREAEFNETIRKRLANGEDVNMIIAEMGISRELIRRIRRTN